MDLDDERVRKKLFYVLAVIALGLTVFFSFMGKEKPSDKETEQQAISKQVPATQADQGQEQVQVKTYAQDMVNQAERLQLEKVISDFCQAYFTSPAGDTVEQFKNRIRPFVSNKVFEELSNVPLPELPTRLVSDPYMQRLGDYKYRVSLTIEEIFEGKPSKVTISINVNVDKSTGRWQVSEVMFR